MRYIITETQYKNLKLRRNLDFLPKFISSTYKWLNPKAFNDFEEFLDRVIFSTTRDFVGDFIENPDEYDVLINKIEPTVREMVMGQYYDEILNYYTNHP